MCAKARETNKTKIRINTLKKVKNQNFRKMKKLFLIPVLLVLVAISSSCEKEEQKVEPKPTDQEVLLSQVDYVIDMTNDLKFATDPWGSYPILYSTGNSADDFSVGLYAVKIQRNWWNPSTLSFMPSIQKQDTDDIAYTWAYKYDENGNQIYYSGVKSFLTATTQPIPQLSISGSESIVYVFKVNTPGEYMYWY